MKNISLTNHIHQEGFFKKNRFMFLSCILSGFFILLCLPLGAIGKMPSATPTNPHEVYPAQDTLPKGIVGLAVHISAHRVGDPAKMYIRAVHPEGPAGRAGLAHGEEIIEVNGQSLAGKTYQQVIRLIRGEVGQSVNLKIDGQKGIETVSLMRVNEEQLMGRQRKTSSF